MTTSLFSRQLTLTCSTTCTLTGNPTYIWYKNGHKVKEDTSSLNSDYFSDADSYSCTIKYHEDLHSPAIPEDLTTDPRYAGRVEYAGEKDSGRSTLRITDLREEDSAEYKFIFNTQTSGWGYSFPGTTLTVTDGPKNTSVSVSPSGGIVEGSSVTLTCSSDANPHVDKYTWYKKNVTSPKASGHRYTITKFSTEDSGEYYCVVENKYGCLNSSSVFLDVQCKYTYSSSIH
eukprot:XP_014057384.1 PREDICTED: sialoadhesin-like [Salmo salar]